MFKALKFHCWTKPYLKAYAAWAAYKEKRHPYPIGSMHDGKKIVGREILRDKDGTETFTGLYLEEGKKVILLKLVMERAGDG